MKIKSIAVAAVSLIAFGASAQKSKVVSAYNYNKSYERDNDCSELTKGITAIDEAVKDAKTGTYAKTWYYGGNLYFNAALAPDKECSDKFPEALDKTYTFYLNALKYNIDDAAAHSIDIDTEEGHAKLVEYVRDKSTSYNDIGYTRDILEKKFPYIANDFINRGVEFFKANEFKKAKDYSLKSVDANKIIGKEDSLGMYNAALAAERLKEYDEALRLYNALTDIEYGGSAIYLYKANLYVKKGEEDKKIDAIREGLAIYPNDAELIKEELAYLLANNKTEEAFANFDKAIANEPSNATLYYNRGLINDQLGNVEKADADYSKAISIKPDFFDAAYNLGGMYYNLGVEWNNTAANYGLNETSKYKAASTKASNYFSKALPALEKAHKIDPENGDTMRSLLQIYAIKGEDAKWKAMKTKLGR